jgi:hypothetical protein
MAREDLLRAEALNGMKRYQEALAECKRARDLGLASSRVDEAESEAQRQASIQ